MPTAMEVGLRQSTLPLSPIQPRRLLDIIERLPGLEDGNPERWMEGVTWEPWPCHILRVDSETDCVATDLGAQIPAPQECQPWLTQTPFRIQDALKRSTLDYTSNQMGERLEVRYWRQLSATFAGELINGYGGSTHSLSTDAVAPGGAAFGSAALAPHEGLEVLEEFIAGQLQGGVGYIHCPPGMLGRLVMTAGVYLVGDHWETPAGNVVISDAGYTNPEHPVGGGSSGIATTDWLYCSGPVFYASTAPMLIGDGSGIFAGDTGGFNDTTPWNRNTILQYLTGYGILVFDPCPVSAVLVDYTL